MKDVVNNNTNIFLLNNEHLGSFIKNWKGNFNNLFNDCFKNSFSQSFIHSVVKSLVDKEEAQRKKKGLPTAKNFKDYNPHSKENDFYGDILGLFDTIKEKMKNNDLKPLINTFDKSLKPMDQNYSTGGSYPFNRIADISLSSTSSSSGLPGGGFSVLVSLGLNKTYVNEHVIVFKEKTVISDCIGIEIRNFKECSSCYSNDISVINIGNIVIPIYDYLNTLGEKSFYGLLKYYYKINNFGKTNAQSEYCNKCKKNNLKNYNKISTLPDVLLIDFNLDKYYINANNSKLKEESFYWTLEEYISLIDYYEDINHDGSGKNDCYYELTSFTAHYGNKEHGHFINFSKIDEKWYLFDDLREKSIEIGNFFAVKYLVEKQDFAFLFGMNKIEVKSKLKICYCFYNRYRCMGYEKYIEEIKNKIKSLKK